MCLWDYKMPVGEYVVCIEIPVMIQIMIICIASEIFMAIYGVN